MHFPVSGVDVPIWVPPLAAFTISFFTSMGGISGAFLLLPFQVSVLGFTAPAVSGTNHIFNLVAIPSGVYRYIREGRMLRPLAATVVAGTLPGVVLGAWIRVALLPDPHLFKRFAGCVLLYIGARLAWKILRRYSRAGGTEVSGRGRSGPRLSGPLRLEGVDADLRRVTFTLQGKRYTFRRAPLFLLCLAVGVLGGAYGIGGGSIVAPLLVTAFGLPVYAVAGAMLAGTFATSVVGVIAFQVLGALHGAAASPDWLLGIAFGIGGAAGIYLGARCQKYFPVRVIEGILCACILFTAVKYVAGF